MTKAAATTSPSFGDLLRGYRERASLSQEDLAERAGVTSQAIGALERGERQNPYPTTVRRLAEGLGLSEEERSALVAALPLRGQRPEPVRDAAGRSPAPPSGESARLMDGLALPAPLTPLLGRDGEVAAVTELLRRGVRLLTLTGPGGVGKTRLAVHIAVELWGQFPDGVAFVPLAQVADAGLVLSTIAQVLEVREHGDQALDRTLLHAIGERRLLLVLDNCEHVLAGLTGAAALLERCRNLVVLATSRQALRIRGEQVYAVSPLALPSFEHAVTVEEAAGSSAVQLFVERARAASSGFALNAENAPAVAALCGRLDGLPLALELVAPRIKLLPPQALLGRLHRALPLLTSGSRDLPARQQTLRSAIAWSYGMLDESEQALFRRLAVFAGGCALEAAEMVCAPSDGRAAGELEVLESLVEKSLLQVHPGDEEHDEPRFSLLETIREYATEQLETSGEEATIREAHATYFGELAEQAASELNGPHQRVWLDRLDRDLDNLRAALAWARDQEETERGLRLAVALHRFWVARGYWSEARRWLEEGLERGQGVAPALRAGTLCSLGALALEHGELERATQLLTHAASRFVALDDRAGLTRTLILRGITAIYQGAYDQATALLEEGLRLARELGDQQESATALLQLGILARHQGNLPAARERGRAALAEDRTRVNPHTILWTTMLLGVVSMEEGSLEDAEPHLHQALALARELADKASIAYALVNLGDVATRQGQYSSAEKYLRESVLLGKALGDKYLLESFLNEHVQLAAARGQAGPAARLGGADAKVREALGIVLPIVELNRQERALDRARAQLGEEGFQRAWADGRTMGLDEAVAYALEQSGRDRL